MASRTFCSPLSRANISFCRFSASAVAVIMAPSQKRFHGNSNSSDRRDTPARRGYGRTTARRKQRAAKPKGEEGSLQ